MYICNHTEHICMHVLRYVHANIFRYKYSDTKATKNIVKKKLKYNYFMTLCPYNKAKNIVLNLIPGFAFLNINLQGSFSWRMLPNIS